MAAPKRTTEGEILQFTEEYKRLIDELLKATDAHDAAWLGAKKVSREQGKAYDQVYKKLNAPALLERQMEAAAAVRELPHTHKACLSIGFPVSAFGPIPDIQQHAPTEEPFIAQTRRSIQAKGIILKATWVSIWPLLDRSTFAQLHH